MIETQVFLSFSETDRKLAKALEKSLEARGIETWSSGEQTSGSSIDQAIRKRLNQSSHVIVLFSQDAFDAPNVLFEMGAAFAENKNVIGVFLSQSARRNVPFDLANVEVLRASGLRPAQLADRIANIIGVGNK